MTRSFKRFNLTLLNQDLTRNVTNLDRSETLDPSIVADTLLTSCNSILNVHAPQYKQ